MTKNDLVVEIARDLRLRQVDVKRIIQRTLDGIIDILEKEGKIELRNFGVFKVKKRKARRARNPKTNAEVFVPEKQVVTFQPGRIMKMRIK